MAVRKVSKATAGSGKATASSVSKKPKSTDSSKVLLSLPHYENEARLTHPVPVEEGEQKPCNS